MTTPIQRYVHHFHADGTLRGMDPVPNGAWCESDDVAAVERERDAFRDELTRAIQQLNEASCGIGAIKAHAASNYMTLARERDALAAEVARLRECYTECKLDNIVLRERPMSIEAELAFRNKIRASWAEPPLPAPPGQSDAGLTRPSRSTHERDTDEELIEEARRSLAKDLSTFIPVSELKRPAPPGPDDAAQRMAALRAAGHVAASADEQQATCDETLDALMRDLPPGQEG